MKVFTLCALLASVITLRAEDLKTTAGIVYKNVTITGHDAIGINIVHSDGAARVKFSDLSPETSARYGYKPEAAAAQEKAEAETARARQILAAAGAGTPTKTPANTSAFPAKKTLKDGINILNFGARETDRSGEYSHVAWKVEMLNNSEDELRDITVQFSFRDGDDYEMESATKYDISILPKKRVVITDNKMMKTEVWTKVDAFAVKTK